MTHASLNRSFRLVRRADAQVVPVPETARGHGAARAVEAVAAALFAIAAVPFAAAAPPGANQLPTGGTLAAGQATLQTQGTTLTVNQSSQRAVIDWQSFNLGSQATVVFNQAAGRSGATLNRVLDSQPSQIMGRIQAPGQVFISNPAGVIFGSTARVDVGGLVATSMSMAPADFMAGGTNWQRNDATGAVVNAGALTAADGGYVALLAPEVRNEGVIVARAGTVALAAGEAIRLEFAGTGLSGVQVTPAQLKTLIENRQAILAPDGQVILSARSADALRSGVVNQAGVIDAGSLVSRGGRVLLEGDDITLAAGSRTDATGATGGGSVLVGGDWQGSGTMHQATRVTMQAGAGIDVSATQQGDGGKAVLWSETTRADSSTSARGTIVARGGAQGGDGGRIETSGHQVDTAGSTVNASAAKGKSGLWLIDPTDITIGATEAAGYAATLEGGTNVLVQTAATGADAGDITVASEIAWGNNAASTLTLSAARNININAPISVLTPNGGLALEYGQGALAAGNASRYQVNAPVTLPSGQHFSTKLGSDGATVAYTVINALGVAGDTGGTTLQGISGDLAGHYVLGSTIDASPTATWNGGAGFAPLGDGGTLFSGTLDGLGHFVTDLTINRPGAQYVGLFGNVDFSAVIANVGLPRANITGGSQVGALVGRNTGTVSGAFSTGQVTATSDVAGGLVGNAIGGSITDSYSTADVASAGNYAGGLAANNGSAVSNSYATGNVTGANFVGGLIGYQNNNSGSSVTNSYASGTATGSAADVGNLIGYRDNGVTVVNSSGGVDVTSAATFAGWDLVNRWNQYDGHTAPLLSAFMRPVTVLAPDSMTYSGNLNVDPALITSSDPAALATLGGSLRYGGSAAPAAGTYSGVTLTGLYSDQMGSRIVFEHPSTLTINPALLTVTGGVATSKVYDGTTAAAVTGTSVSGVVAGDNVSLVVAGSFADPNVGTAKSVTTAYTLTGTAAGNYAIVQPAQPLTADITQLASVTWVGGAGGDWFAASNWAGGAVPTLANVANVTIPSGTVATLANSNSSNAPMLTSLTGAGGVQLSRASLSTTGAVALDSVSVGTGATLAVGSLSTNHYTQSGGSLAVAGALAVNGSFVQTDGLIRAGGAATITQANGNLDVQHLVAGGLNLTAAQGDLSFANLGSVGDASLHASGDVSQLAGGSLTVLGGASVVAGGNVSMDQPRNMVVGSVAVQGRDVSLMQGLDDLVLGNVVASGNLSLSATRGNIRQADSTAITVAGTTSAAAPRASIYLMNVDNRFGGAVSASGSDIGITQGANPLVLGDVTASANLAVASGGAVTQVGALVVAGKTSVDAAANSVVLGNAANDFTGTVSVKSGALTLVDGVGGLSLGGVQTSGETVVSSTDGAIVQNSGSFATTSPSTARFSAWKDGAYTSVGLNTSATVLINGQLTGPDAGASVGGGMASVLNGFANPPTDSSTTEATTRRRATRILAIPSTAPIRGQ